MPTHTLTTDPLNLKLPSGDHFEQVEEALLQLSHICKLVGQVASWLPSQCPDRLVSADDLAAVFTFVGRELGDLRLHVVEGLKELHAESTSGGNHE